MEIEGLKVRIEQAELERIMRSASKYHAGRAASYRAQAQVFAPDNKEGDEENLRLTSVQTPYRQMMEKVKEHSSKSEELEFMADHLIPDAVYILDRHDLRSVGAI